MLLSEEYGVNSGNVDQITTNLSAAAPEVQRIFAKDQAGAEMARKLEINPTWATAIIKSVGNCGEVFERNLGRRNCVKARVDVADQGFQQLVHVDSSFGLCRAGYAAP
jgi:hypothetical protein